MSRIVKVNVQLKGESKPEEHYALVFDDAMGYGDFIVYRNALTTAAKAIATEEDTLCTEEIFWLIQLSEFINTALDYELYWKRNVV